MLRYYLAQLRYVQSFGKSDAESWEVAAKRIPFSYRWFGRSLTVAEVDAELSQWDKWKALKAQLESGDRICPFTINPYSMAMRRGYVVIRGREPIGGVVVEMS